MLLAVVFKTAHPQPRSQGLLCRHLAEPPGGGPSEVAKVINHPLVHCLLFLEADQLGPVEERSHCQLCKEGLLLFPSEQGPTLSSAVSGMCAALRSENMCLMHVTMS